MEESIWDVELDTVWKDQRNLLWSSLVTHSSMKACSLASVVLSTRAFAEQDRCPLCL